MPAHFPLCLLARSLFCRARVSYRKEHPDAIAGRTLLVPLMTCLWHLCPWSRPASSCRLCQPRSEAHIQYSLPASITVLNLNGSSLLGDNPFVRNGRSSARRHDFLPLPLLMECRYPRSRQSFCPCYCRPSRPWRPGGIPVCHRGISSRETQPLLEARAQSPGI